jgi:hypothetical protein
VTFSYEVNNMVFSSLNYLKFQALNSYLFNYLQEEYVQKTDLASAPLSFKDEQKKEVRFLIVFTYIFTAIPCYSIFVNYCILVSL